MRPFRTMLKTESKLSLRGMDMVTFTTVAPLVMLVILGVICRNRPAFERSRYSFLEQSFGTLSAIAICADGAMGLLLIVSGYRGEHILKRYQVTPVSPALILPVQMAIYTLCAIISLLSLYLTAAVFFGYRFHGSPAAFLFGYLLVMVSVFSIGMMVGGVASNAEIANIIASILYFPMLLFSGTTLPYEIMPKMLQKFAGILPLTQGIKFLKIASLGLPITSVTGSVLIMAILAVFYVAVPLRLFKWETES